MADNNWNKQTDALEALAQSFGTIQQQALRAVVGAIKPRVIEATPVQVSGEQGGDTLQPGQLKASVRGRVLKQTAENSAKAVVDWGKQSWIANIVDRGHRAPHARTLQRAGRTTTGKPTPAHPFVRAVQDGTAAAAQTAYEESMTEQMTKALQGN